MVTTWRTHKTAAGLFHYRVYQFGYQVPDIILRTGVCATRAQAVGQAKRWTMFFKRGGKIAA